MAKITIPLFPLQTVLFPGGVLPLKIFEPRYVEMISSCMKKDSGFGVCLIRHGEEVGEVADVYEIGTLGTIRYFHTLPDGLLGITVKGQQRFQIIASEVQPNKLIMAEIELLDNEEHQPLDEEYDSVVAMLKDILEQLGPPYSTLDKEFDNATWVGQRLVELLPLDLEHKQRLLQMSDPIGRLAQVYAMLSK